MLAGVRGIREQPARLLMYSAGLTVLACSGVAFNQGHGWADRYFYPALMVIPVVAAGLIVRSGRDGEMAGLATTPRLAGVLVAGSLTILNATALVITGRFIHGQLGQRRMPDPAHHQVIVLDGTHGYHTNDWRPVSRKDTMSRSWIVRGIVYASLVRSVRAQVRVARAQTGHAPPVTALDR